MLPLSTELMVDRINDCGWWGYAIDLASHMVNAAIIENRAFFLEKEPDAMRVHKNDQRSETRFVCFSNWKKICVAGPLHGPNGFFLYILFRLVILQI